MERYAVSALAKEILAKKEFYEQTFRDYSNYGENMPISPIELQKVNKNNDNVFITEDGNYIKNEHSKTR